MPLFLFKLHQGPRNQRVRNDSSIPSFLGRQLVVRDLYSNERPTKGVNIGGFLYKAEAVGSPGHQLLIIDALEPA
ncbi:hypothetical protein E4U61_001229 [Claviceps capensis]|nr:hypothetical protein E4U61_001229 [Claviceps capensis]